MADSFEGVLAGLMERFSAIKGAGFLDIDGSEIAATPASALERIKAGGAYGGIQLRRLQTAEQAAGRGGVRHVELVAEQGRLLAFGVGSEYQLILVLDGSPAPGVVAAASEAVSALEAGI